MQLSHMKIKYFRCFDNLEIDFQTHKPNAEKTSPMDGLTVLVGRNGEGKTAVLDAINIAWNPFFRRFPECKINGFKKSDRPSRPYETAEGNYESRTPYVEGIFETDLPFEPQLELIESEGMVNVFSEREAYYSDGKFRTRTNGKLPEISEFLMKGGKNNDQVR